MLFPCFMMIFIGTRVRAHLQPEKQKQTEEKNI